MKDPQLELPLTREARIAKSGQREMRARERERECLTFFLVRTFFCVPTLRSGKINASALLRLLHARRIFYASPARSPPYLADILTGTVVRAFL